jgi:hypothetical protein
MAKEADPANQAHQANQANQANQAYKSLVATTSATMLLCAVVMASLISGGRSEAKNNLNCVIKFYNGKSYEFCGPSTRKAIPPPSAIPRVGKERPGFSAPPRVGVGEERQAPSVPPRVREERPTPTAAPTVGPTVAPTSVPREQTQAPGVGAGPRPDVRLPARTEVPKQGVGSSAQPRPELLTVRALIDRSELPPRGVAAYGVVAFTSLPIAIDIERYKFVCEAFKATLIPQESLPSGTPLSVQMITFWPINNKHTPDAVRADCSYLIENYDLETGLDAVHDADKQAERLAERRGPFLIAWSPAESRYQSDSLALVMDLSRVDGQQDFLEIFQTWRQKIVDNPSLWHGGFVDIETFRRIVRDTLDRYGDGILKLIKAE